MLIGEMMAPREPFPAGQHIAICYSCVNIGLQEEKFKGVAKVLGKFILTWEFPNLLIVVEKEDGTQTQEPRVMSLSYTASLSEKGKFYAHLMSWLGRTVSGEELKMFDPASLVGKSCLMQVVHENKEGIVRDKVATITPIPEGLATPAQFNLPLVYDYDYEHQVWPDFPVNMPEWMAEKVKSSKQWKAHTLSSDSMSKVAVVKAEAVKPTPESVKQIEVQVVESLAAVTDVGNGQEVSRAKVNF